MSTPTTETIEIYYDENTGWAYRSTCETGPRGSGTIDGRAAEALGDLYEYGMISDEQRAAIADLVDREGWDRARVLMADVGPLWPCETIDDCEDPPSAVQEALNAADAVVDDDGWCYRNACGWHRLEGDRLQDVAAWIMSQ